MSNLTELLAQKTALEQQIQAINAAAKAESVAKVKALMAELGVSLADLGGPRRAPRTVKPKLPPKYRDPATGATWCGLGKRPRWYTAALAAGKTHADLAIF